MFVIFNAFQKCLNVVPIITIWIFDLKWDLDVKVCETFNEKEFSAMAVNDLA